MPRTNKTNKNKKRLCVLSDGTWQTPENVVPTNILKLTMAIDQEDANGMQQVVYYDSGVGTQGAVDKIMGGGFGAGIDINIRELYTFLALNYDEGDEVYLFGFSRGSYTVRSLAGMIYEAGLVRRDQLQFVREAYELYRTNKEVHSERATKFREEHGDRIPITLLACFDTVGSLGLPFEPPKFGFLRKFDEERYRFHSTVVNPLIENAIHLLSIDEDRAIFSPTLMDHDPQRGKEQVTQLYFWGGHCGVGGGDSDQVTSSDFCLGYLVEEMERRGLGLAVEKSALPDYKSINTDEEPREVKEAPWMGLLEFLTGKYVRPIESLEMLHETAIKRYQDCPKWRPAALKMLEEKIMSVKFGK
eukprot:GFKZ01012001.1.p1 GENE.GFKZ01012001.1~~GFKZ01012001.1.p1  ORF type:complete len:359 (-),score=59.19 GFKZ01012001.1:260-1336(-)